MISLHDRLSFISSYYVSLSSQPFLTFSAMSTTPHLLWFLYFIMSLTGSSSSLLITYPYHLSLSSLFLQCLPLHIFCSLHSMISLTGSSSFLLITYPYHLSLSSLNSAMATTPHHLLFSSFHSVSDRLFVLMFCFIYNQTKRIYCPE
jgi:hypothetical protein